MIKITVFLVFVVSCEWGWATDLFLARKEYNAIAAKLDTLARLHDLSSVENMIRRPPTAAPDLKLVLIFWADDEAEVFLNGFLVGRTRLTPTQIEIPSIYLKNTNILQAHCWDTDKVESGFMAGLYVVGNGDDLHPVLLTDEGIWSTPEGFAEVRFYSNSVPDIPRAEVVWGSGMYGEVWLETQFSLRDVNSAKQANAVEMTLSNMKPMESHSVISNMVRLNARKKELESMFSRHNSRNRLKTERYSGYVSRRLAFSLGKAGRLVSQGGAKLAEELDDWRKKMSPEQALQLTAAPSRRLKGIDSHVAEQRADVGSKNEKDRRSNYTPPKDYYQAEKTKSTKIVVKVIDEGLKNKGSIFLWIGLLFLSIYNFFVSRRCWRIWGEER